MQGVSLYHPGSAMQVALDQCVMAANASRCQRRRVGCVYADSSGHVLAASCNGQWEPCPGGPPGTCGCLHAEVRAGLRISSGIAHTAIISAAPCLGCAKVLLELHVSQVFFYEDSTPGVEGIALLDKYRIVLGQLDYSWAGARLKVG